MADKRTYTSEEIGKMTPAERSAAWHGATPESQAALHAANQTDLGGTHDYDSGRGTWTTKNTTKPRTYSAQDISTLAGGYNFNENKIRSMFDNATREEYAAKKIANEGAQAQYARTMGGYITNLSDTMRQSLNKAVATGGSRGLAAAEAMQAAQDATLQSSEQANNLALERMQLDYDEAEAYAKNAKDAESLAQNRKAAALTQALQLGQIDVQTYAAEMGALGNYYYGGDAARQNGYFGLKTTEMNTKNNELGMLLGLLQSNNVTPEGRAELERILGWDEGTLQDSPTPTYSGGSWGSPSGNSPTGAKPTTGNPYLDYVDELRKDTKQQDAAFAKLYGEGDEANWKALYKSIHGVDDAAANKAYKKYVDDNFVGPKKPTASLDYSVSQTVRDPNLDILKYGK